MADAVALAIAIGIGRFAFTPILPLMQEDLGVTLQQAGWLASANYIGYLVGALASGGARRFTATALRFGLLVIVSVTMAMGWTDSFPAWLVLRFIGGVASAWVLVFVSARVQRNHAGIVFAGVGAGIVVAGSASLLLARLHAGSRSAWILLGAIALAGALSMKPSQTAPAEQPSLRRTGSRHWTFVFCHGAFGLAYIIPATFLPVIARETVRNPLALELAWPLFGISAFISTIVAARAAESLGNRRLWIVANLIMGLGVLAPVVTASLFGIALAAACVGGTFMVITMIGLQEARRVAGSHSGPLIAAMTAAFALGQTVGPLLASVASGFPQALMLGTFPLFVATLLLAIERKRVSYE